MNSILQIAQDLRFKGIRSNPYNEVAGTGMPALPRGLATIVLGLPHVDAAGEIVTSVMTRITNCLSCIEARDTNGTVQAITALFTGASVPVKVHLFDAITKQLVESRKFRIQIEQMTGNTASASTWVVVGERQLLEMRTLSPKKLELALEDTWDILKSYQTLRYNGVMN